MFILDDGLAERLALEGNQSRVVNDAVRLYYQNRETVKRLVALADRLDAFLGTQTLPTIRIPLPARESDDEPPHGYVDRTNRQRKWNGYTKEWEPVVQ